MGCSPDDTVCFLIDKYDSVVRPDGGQFGAFEMYRSATEASELGLAIRW